MEIIDIIKKINERQLFVPAFQREYVWKRKDAKNLIRSLLRKYLNNLSIVKKDFKPIVDIGDVMVHGETSILEFKSTLRWNLQEARVDKKMEEIVLKAIAALNNSDGGTLLIGVAETEDGDGYAIGLENDYNTLDKSNKDGFELHLRNLVNKAYGKGFATTQLNVRFPVVDDLEICEIQVKRGKEALYTEIADKHGAKKKKFFVRSGNSSQDMDIDEAAKYISERF